MNIMQNTVLGIDPGLNGGLAFIGAKCLLGEGIEQKGNGIHLYRMPTIAGKDYDIQEIKRLLKYYQPDLTIVEQQISMPGQGLSSTLQTGKGFGILLGLLAGMEMPHQVVPAKAWQYKLFTGVSAKLDTKAKSEIVAKRIFPTADFRKSDRARVAADGLTDAACIAEYARRLHSGVGSEIVKSMKPHTAIEENPNICIKCGVYIPTDEIGCTA